MYPMYTLQYMQHAPDVHTTVHATCTRCTYYSTYNMHPMYTLQYMQHAPNDSHTLTRSTPEKKNSQRIIIGKVRKTSHSTNIDR